MTNMTEWHINDEIKYLHNVISGAMTGSVCSNPVFDRLFQLSVISLFHQVNDDLEKLNNDLDVSVILEGVSIDFDTYLNEKGSGLSLGEMERIAIARAIYSDSPILLLDECSASLDAVTEKKVMSNILNLKDKTIVLISHHKYDEKLFDKVIDLGE